MPGLSKVIVLDPDARAQRQVQLGFEREGVPTLAVAADPGALELPAEDAGLVVVGGVDGQGLDLVRRVRALLAGRGIDAPIVFTGRGVERGAAQAAGADEVVLQPAFLRDVVTIGRLLRGRPAAQRSHLIGSLVELTGVYALVRAFTTLGRSATLTLIRGLRRGEIRFYHGEVTSAQVGMIHGQAALHQLLLWTDARFDFHHEDVVRRQQIPLTHDELFADAERFLDGVRDSSGGLSPSVVLEPHAARVQSFGRQIPTEVYGLLRMFDGHRMLADVLEDSPYRVFETLRVAQRAIEADLLRVVDKPPPRARWRAVLEIEHWLIGADHRGARAPAAAPAVPAVLPPREPAAAASRDKSRKRRKKRRRANTPVALAPAPAPAPAAEIDWGALVPRPVGAEVGPLAGVVPAAHVSGEFLSARPPTGRDRAETQPTVVFDDAAEFALAGLPQAISGAVTARYGDEVAPEAPEAPEARDAGGEREPPGRSSAIRVVATAASRAGEPSHVIDDLQLGDTKPERRGARVQRITTPGVAVAETSKLVPRDVATLDGERPATAAFPTTVVLGDRVPVETSGAITAKVAVPPPVAALAVPPATPSDPAPAAIHDEPSDGVIRQQIITAETAPVKRRRIASDPPDDDRPGDATGEITMRDAPVEPIIEPSILVADLAGELPARPDAAAPTHEISVAAARSDAVAFTEAEEAFFRAGHDKDLPHPDSFDDLDVGYQRVGFWDRLRGKAPLRPPSHGDPPIAPADPADEPAKKP